MKINFQRITSSGNFVPEIDGLRFIAILSVVLYHVNGFLEIKAPLNHQFNNSENFITIFLSHGHFGVEMFFVISGYILGYPLMKNNFLGKRNNLKSYFMRRLTRLEPPYIIVMSLLLAAHLFIIKSLAIAPALRSYFASIFYSHNFIYGGLVLPKLNAPVWSLEIEIQFYIVAPVVAFLICKMRTKSIFGFSFILILSALFCHNYITSGVNSILNYLHYFVLGFLLAFLKIKQIYIFKLSKFGSVLGIALLFLIFLVEPNTNTNAFERTFLELVQLVMIFLFYYLVLFNNSLSFLKNKIITNIGGMCYTIYLIHYPIISILGNFYINSIHTESSTIFYFGYYMTLLTGLIVASSLFYLAIERPCMKRDWYKKLVLFSTK